MSSEVTVGVDIVHIGAMRASLARFGRRLTRRVFTASEISYCDGTPHAAQSYAARFAAKEALIKAIGLDSSLASFTNIEVHREPTGAPTLALTRDALERAEQLGIRGLSVSLSHDGDYAVGTVVAIR